jgi:hypothetical protein
MLGAMYADEDASNRHPAASLRRTFIHHRTFQEPSLPTAAIVKYSAATTDFTELTRNGPVQSVVGVRLPIPAAIR